MGARSTTVLRHLAAVSLAAWLGAGCFYDVDRSLIGEGDTDTSTADAGPGDGGGETGDASGIVTIAGGLPAASYAVGDLYLSVMAECPTTQAVETYLIDVVEGLDFSYEGAAHAFALHGVPEGVTFLGALFDADGDADPEAPEAGSGDVVTMECAEIDLAAGEVVTGLELTLSYAIP